MNTDVILDFVVENYIWFIIGGVVILLAILGLVADKKKIIPKDKKKQNNLEDKNATKIEESIVSNAEPEVLEPMATGLNNENSYVQENNENEEVLDILEPQDVTEKMVFDASQPATETINFDEKNDELNNEPQQVNIFTQPNLIREENVITNEFINNDDSAKDDNLLINQNQEFENNILNQSQETFEERVNDGIGEMPNQNEKMNFESNISIENVEQSNPSLNSDDSIQKEDNDSKFAFSTVDDDINKINELKFSDDDKTTELEKESEEKLEDTMQISYSQLKEIVQDIIAENEAENDSEKEKYEKIESNGLSNQEEVANTSTISQDNSQLENEDDVWKF